MEDIILALNFIKVLIAIYIIFSIVVILLGARKKISIKNIVKILGSSGLIVLLSMMILLKIDLLPGLGIFLFCLVLLFYVYLQSKDIEKKNK